MNIIKIYKDIATYYKSYPTMEEFLTAIGLATAIIYEDGIHLIYDKKYIYFFGALPEARNPSKLGRFIKKYNHLVIGKLFKSNNIIPFINGATKINEGIYRWEG